MTRLRSVLALLTTSVVLSLAASSAAAEHLASQEVPGFVVGYRVANDREDIREEVPAGETVQDWTRMVTTQRFAGSSASGIIAVWNVEYLAASGADDWSVLRLMGPCGILNRIDAYEDVFIRGYESAAVACRAGGLQRVETGPGVAFGGHRRHLPRWCVA